MFESPDVKTIYEIPLVLHKQEFDSIILNRLGIDESPEHKNIEYLQEFIQRYKNPEHTITIAMCGKYNSLHDAYKSILEAFIHAGVENNASVQVKWVDTEKIEELDDVSQEYNDVDGILIPGGFGDRGIEGKILSSQFARENGIPFFGICLGLQCAVIDFARNVCEMNKANSTEFIKTAQPVIDLIHGQKNVAKKGATMRLGSYACDVISSTNASRAYGKRKIEERHRHRYEVNNKYRDKLEKCGLIFSGVNQDLGLVEMIEIPKHPWVVGVQFHPELKSRVVKAHPLFREFISAAVNYRNGKS